MHAGMVVTLDVVSDKQPALAEADSICTNEIWYEMSITV